MRSGSAGIGRQARLMKNTLIREFIAKNDNK